jgi:hypothetical protein
VIGIVIKGVTNPNGVLSGLTCTIIGQNRARTTQHCTISIEIKYIKIYNVKIILARGIVAIVTEISQLAVTVLYTSIFILLLS